MCTCFVYVRDEPSSPRRRRDHEGLRNDVRSTEEARVCRVCSSEPSAPRRRRGHWGRRNDVRFHGGGTCGCALTSRLHHGGGGTTRAFATTSVPRRRHGGGFGWGTCALSSRLHHGGGEPTEVLATTPAPRRRHGRGPRRSRRGACNHDVTPVSAGRSCTM